MLLESGGTSVVPGTKRGVLDCEVALASSAFRFSDVAPPDACGLASLFGGATLFGARDPDLDAVVVGVDFDDSSPPMEDMIELRKLIVRRCVMKLEQSVDVD